MLFKLEFSQQNLEIESDLLKILPRLAEFFNADGRVDMMKLLISVFNQLDAQSLFHNKFYFMPLHV